MRKKLIIGGVATILGVAVLGLSGCSKSHKPLNGVYYGYYDQTDNNRFVILAFDANHPGKVAIRQNLDGAKTNSVFPINYAKQTVTIHTRKPFVVMDISNDGYKLTCPSCNGKSLPKTYSIGMSKGKAFDPKVASIAFNSIAKDSKTNGGYQP